MKFLALSEDKPRIKEQGVRVEMPRPDPGVHEHRIYFNFREETRIFEDVEEVIPVADFVSCLSGQEPTTAEWDKLLKDNGFSQSQIDNILN